jgi:hypothetical protein
MLKRVGFFFILVSALSSVALAQGTTDQPSANSGIHEAADARVRIDRVSKVLVDPSTPAYLVSYHYDFHGSPTVYIRQLGQVPPQGSFEYLVTEARLDFRDAGGKGLALVPLRPTITVASKTPLNQVPRDEEFPPQFRSYPWNQAEAFQVRANSVLGAYFHYLPHEVNKLDYLATTYTPLTLPADLSKNGVTAVLALLFTFPFDATTSKYSIHVQSLVKEGRTHGDIVKPTDEPRILSAADTFLDKLIRELSR